MASTVQIGNVTCEPGEIKFGSIPSVYLRDGSRLQIPISVVNGAEDGPTIWLGSTLHGNEIPGIEVIRQITREIVDPKTLRGTILSCPVQHPITYLESVRNTPQDGININRVFPGNPNGSITERIAYDLFHEGISKADVVLDYHCNVDKAVSFNILRSGGEGPGWDEQWPIAEAFGMTIAVAEVSPSGLSGMLQDAAIGAGKPALTVEFDGAYLMNMDSVRAGVTGTLNVMKYLKMIDGEIEPQTEIQVIDQPLTDRHHITCDTGGVVYPLVPIGEKVTKGQPVVIIRDIFGNELETVNSPIDGWVITYTRTDNHTVNSGDTVVFVFGVGDSDKSGEFLR